MHYYATPGSASNKFIGLEQYYRIDIVASICDEIPAQYERALESGYPFAIFPEFLLPDELRVTSESGDAIQTSLFWYCAIPDGRCRIVYVDAVASWARTVQYSLRLKLLWCGTIIGSLPILFVSRRIVPDKYWMLELTTLFAFFFAVPTCLAVISKVAFKHALKRTVEIELPDITHQQLAEVIKKQTRAIRRTSAIKSLASLAGGAAELGAGALVSEIFGKMAGKGVEWGVDRGLNHE